MKFTDENFKDAIIAGIFDTANNVAVTPATVIRFFERWATNKEKEFRHRAAEIALTAKNPYEAHRDIMNLQI